MKIYRTICDKHFFAHTHIHVHIQIQKYIYKIRIGSRVKREGFNRVAGFISQFSIAYKNRPARVANFFGLE